MNDWDSRDPYPHNDEKPKRQPKWEDAENFDSQEVLREVDQHLNQFGIDLDLVELARGDTSTEAAVSHIHGGSYRRNGGWIALAVFSITAFILLIVLLPAIGGLTGLTNALSPLICPSNTTFQAKMTGFEGDNMLFQCVDSDLRPVRDVTTSIVGAVVVISLLFLGVFFFAIFRAVANVKRYATGGMTFTTSSRMGTPHVTVVRTNIGKHTVSMNPAEVFQQMSDLMGIQPDTTERLRELKEAYDAGLITREEYDQKRKQILDAL